MTLSSNKKYILWDMDGVIVNTEPQHYRAWERTFRRLFGLPAIDFDKYKPCIGATLDVFRDIMLREYGIDMDENPDTRQEYIKDKLAVEEEEGFPEVPGVSETVRLLYERGCVMAIASSSPQEYIERIARILGIEDCFRLLFSGERVAHSKPAPDTFLEAAKGIGAKPGECIVIEDSENGTKAAKAAGMYCIGFVNPDSGDQDLGRADVLVHEIPEVIGVIERLP